MTDIQLTGFEMISKLGQGGMATVWKARQISLNRTVAIKILSSKFASDPSDIQRFQQEAQSAAKLKHPGIVQVYDANIENGLYFFVMEFVDGYTCADWQIRKGHLDEKDILLIADCVADALGYAWEREKMIHCDIKPDNIMIDEDGTVKVTDLGLARTISTMSLEESDEIMGTPAYMAPEQAMGEAGLDCRTDMYSLGAMMYHLSTGKLLFEECPEEEVMERQVNDFAKNPRDLNPSLTRGFCRLIEVLMAKEQAGRPADWQEVRAAIAKIKKGIIPKFKVQDGISSTVMKSVTDADPDVHGHAASYRTASREGGSRGPKRLPLIIICAVLLACIGCAIWVIKARSGKKPPAAAVPGDPGSGAGGLLPGESQSEMQARQLYYRASSWEQKNPSAIEESISLYSEVVQSAGGTKYAERAEKDISRLKTAMKERSVHRVLAALKSSTEADVVANRYAQAISAYETYAGDCAAETRDARAARVAELKQMQARWEESEKQRLANQRKIRFEAFLDEVAGSVLKGNFGGALSIAERVVDSGEFKADEQSLEYLVQILRDASEIDHFILNSFIQQQGQFVDVELIGGTKKYMINEARDGMVYASNVINVRGATASVSANFSIKDISMGERLKRMGSDSQPHVALVKGVMAYGSRSYEHAQRLFAATHELLAPRLLALVAKGSQSLKQDDLKQKVGRMLGQAGVDVGAEYDAAKWIDALRSARITRETLQQLRQNASVLQRESEHDALYGEVSPVIGAVLALEPSNGPAVQEPREPDRAAGAPVEVPENLAPLVGNPEMIIERLIADNPSLGSEDVSMRKDDEGRVIQVRIRNNELANIAAIAGFRDLKSLEIRSDWRGVAPLSDLSPIAGLPLERLVIDGAKIANLLPLRDLPLKELLLLRTEVRDIVPLRGLRLETIDLSGSKVFDFSVLALMPMRSFAARNSQLKQLLFMRDWQLESLDVSDTAVYDLSSAARMPLKRLHIANTQVKAMDMFNNCPLEDLNISGTGIRDISSLRNHSDTLKRLQLDRAPVRNFDIFRNLDLEFLSLEGTEFSDTQLISHMNLRELNLNGSKVVSIESIKTEGLEVLQIEKTGVSSINCLKGSGIRRLFCRGSGVRNFMPIYDSAITHITIDDPEDKRGVFANLPKLEYVNGKWWERN